VGETREKSRMKMDYAYETDTDSSLCVEGVALIESIDERPLNVTLDELATRMGRALRSAPNPLL